MEILRRNNGNAWHSYKYAWKKGDLDINGVEATTDITTQPGFENLFTSLEDKEAYFVTIQSSATIYIRLNDDTNDIITITPTDPLEVKTVIVNKIFISTGGNTANVTIKLT